MVTFTKHANKRHRQRGYRDKDIGLLIRYGTVTDDGVFLTNKDVNQRKRELKREAADLDRLAGTYTVLQEGRVVTSYRPSKTKQRHLIRN